MSPLSAVRPPDPVEVLVATLLRDGLVALRNDRAAAHACVARAFTLLESSGAQQRETGQQGLSAWQRRRVLAYIDANIERSISMSALAREARLSSGYFMSAFKRYFGVTPHAFVVQRRIARAQTIMLSTNEPLSQVALACGFSDQAHFTRRFRRAVGAPPRAWRREHRDESDHAVGEA